MSNATCISTFDQRDLCVCSHGYTGDGKTCQGIKLINLAGTQTGNPGFEITFFELVHGVKGGSHETAIAQN